MTEEEIKEKAIMAAANFKDWHHPQMSFYDGYMAGYKQAMKDIG